MSPWPGVLAEMRHPCRPPDLGLDLSLAHPSKPHGRIQQLEEDVIRIDMQQTVVDHAPRLQQLSPSLQQHSVVDHAPHPVHPPQVSTVQLHSVPDHAQLHVVPQQSVIDHAEALLSTGESVDLSSKLDPEAAEFSTRDPKLIH